MSSPAAPACDLGLMLPLALQGCALQGSTGAVSATRWLLTASGLGLWLLGLLLLAEMSYALGGAVIVLGGAFLVLAASGGRAHFWEGLTNWLFFWR